MDRQKKVHDFCKVMLLSVLTFRLCLAGFPQKLLSWLTQPDTTQFLIYLETGRDVRFSFSSDALPVFRRESAPPRLPEQELPVFTDEDESSLSLISSCSRKPNIKELLTRPLDWDLTDGEPAVLILSTHTTESYTQEDELYVESSPFRTLEEEHNMLCVGHRVEEILTESGIRVIRDRQIHDYPSYNGSYLHARKSIQTILKENPSIRVILDLHRDASGSIHSQLRTEAMIENQTGAQLMLVMGTNASGQTHPLWEENLSLALKLHVLLERSCPGIMRPVSLRAQRFNQDLSPGALLIEVGAAGNTRQEALLAAEQLAKAIVSLAKGTKKEGSGPSPAT